MRAHNICFHGEIRKYQYFWTEKSIKSYGSVLLHVNMSENMSENSGCMANGLDLDQMHILCLHCLLGQDCQSGYLG